MSLSKGSGVILAQTPLITQKNSVFLLFLKCKTTANPTLLVVSMLRPVTGRAAEPAGRPPGPGAPGAP